MARRKDPHENLSRRERQIMDVLFRRGRATVAEVLAEMPDPPSYSAVRATLRVLEGKGRVEHRQEGPRYVYVAVAAPDKVRTDALHHLVHTFFGGSAEQAAVALLRMADVEMTEAELERLAREVREAEAEGR